jgi:hypothetical protein
MPRILALTMASSSPILSTYFELSLLEAVGRATAGGLAVAGCRAVADRAGAGGASLL